MRIQDYTYFQVLGFCFFMTLRATCVAQAQSGEGLRKQGEIIVQLTVDAEIDEVVEISRRGEKTNLLWEKAVAKDWHIHLLSFDEQTTSADDVLSALRADPRIQFAQLNYAAEDRVLPNDAEWFRQWNMNLIQAPAAWDITTGGVTAQGDTIVLAVLEKGYYRNHPDYQSNRWYNHQEVPLNNIDDDANGYTDDFNGYNPRFANDSAGILSNHGTGVTGIAGAQGNNSVGVTGVNWNVKLMNVSSTEYENEIIAGYYYVYEMRKLYNVTNGQKGAFVVATNASFGIDRQKEIDHPLWCAVYDSLGKVGVINIGATSNQNINVDVEGDMPTTCSSPYLITVTNIDQTDSKPASAGYGPINIDLGAPGTGTYTTSFNGSTAGYSTLGGTSSSAPHVTGAVGLIYSLPCPGLAQDALTQPSTTAETVRDLIYSHLDDNITLKNITKYEGRLNVFKPIQAAEKLYCKGGFGPIQIEDAYVDATKQLRVEGVVADNSTYLLRVHNSAGALMFEKNIQSAIGAIRESVDTRNWAADIYFVSLAKGKEITTRRFLKI